MLWNVSHARNPPAPTSINAYSFQTSAPFVLDEDAKTGVNYALIKRIEKLAPNLSITLVLLPRLRLDRVLANEGFDGMVLLVDPSWFNDHHKSRYVWSEPLIQDRNLVVSLTSAPIEFRTVSSLSSRIIGGVRGYHYDGLDFRVKAGWTRRLDVNYEKDLLRILRMRSVDAVIISQMCFNALSEEHRPEWFVAPRPQQEYQRRILMSANRTDVHQTIKDAVHIIARDPQWHQLE